MIRIRNMGGPPNGVCQYEVGINNHSALATFKHDRRDGLAVCLRRAANAIDIALLESVQEPDNQGKD